ncbi:hypothetical protein GF420_15690 [candidate division GN15 bacterium]|nr:hypothetical protein [candidate division GN15 bacterium]
MKKLHQSLLVFTFISLLAALACSVQKRTTPTNAFIAKTDFSNPQNPFNLCEVELGWTVEELIFFCGKPENTFIKTYSTKDFWEVHSWETFRNSTSTKSLEPLPQKEDSIEKKCFGYKTEAFPFSGNSYPKYIVACSFEGVILSVVGLREVPNPPLPDPPLRAN